MNNQRNQIIFPMLLSLFIGSQIFAQDFIVDMKKLEKAYEADFSSPFTISFKDTTKTKVNIALKQGETAFLLKENADLTNFTIKFSPSGEGLTVTDKDDKQHKLSNKPFAVVLGEQNFSVNPSNTPSKGSDSGGVTIDLKGAKDYQTDFTRNFKLSFKSEDAKSQDVILSQTSSSGKDEKLSFKKKDLTKFQIPFVSNKGELTINDDQGKALNDDEGKPFKIDEGKFTVKVGNQSFNVSKILKEDKQENTADQNGCKSVIIIDSTMLVAVSGAGGCQLCDIRSKKEEIESKNDRIYSTDYIVIYDPLLKKDAYAICKHVFEKIKSGGGKSGKAKYYERYIKIAPKWFAPHVGSQIRFEVVNLPLNSTLKLSVDENDVFNGGASQFASIINNLVNANIISPFSGAAKPVETTNAKPGIQGGNEDVCFLTDIDRIATELLKYMTAFRLSSCAIEQHVVNLPIILSRINELFELSAATVEQLKEQLTQKIIAEVSDDEKKLKAIQKAELIVNALQALENVKPLAYTTIRAKNRDFIAVRYSDANNVLSKPENIRMSGGMKIDFSAGFVLTGLRDYSYVLKNIKYNYTPPDGGLTLPRDTTGNVIIKEDEGNNQIGVCLLTHFYPRLSSHYNLGGTVGLMTSTNLNLRLMLGGSILVSSLFGSNNRVSFSGGVVWGKVERLSEKDKDFFNGPRVVNGIPEFYSQASAPEPIEQTNHSWFFAVTLNFGGN